MSIAMLVMVMWMRPNYVDMCRRAEVDRYTYAGEYASVKRVDGQCFIWQKNVGEVYWQGSKGEAILFPALDVPAVQEDYIKTHKGGVLTDCGFAYCTAAEDVHGQRWTCADRRRVLLTDESGKRHCVLFGGEK